jgi:apolipoprotein D and lipocalin family protein
MNAPGRKPLTGRRTFQSGLAAFLLVGGVACHAPRPDAAPLPTAAHVDLDRYAGRWYEIARIPNRFQRQCISDSSATYTRGADGTVAVVNRCRTGDGRFDEAHGEARVVDPRTNAKLQVSFFSLLGWRPIWGDYWVLALGPDYAYAVVGEPGRRYGWILSRTPTLPATTRATINRKLRKLGYAPEQFVDSPHTSDRPATDTRP